MHKEDLLYHFLSPEEKATANHVIYEECLCNKAMKRKKEIENTLKSSRIPEAFLDATVNNFDLSKYNQPDERARAAYAKKMVGEYIVKFQSIKNDGKGLYFHSPTKGCGKSRLALSLANALFKKYALVPVYSTVSDLFDEIKSTWNPGSKFSTANVMDMYRNAQVLILDDIGVEETSGRNNDQNKWKEGMMTKLLDHRMNNKLITIFTANLTIEELTRPSLYPMGRVESRVRKMAYPVSMPNEKVRDAESEQENRAFEQMLMGEG
ncbi:hypothetical protein AB990_03840 [Alkalihalobacillus pseudalcaliphilus]|nr:hypothetical protein AB990_03840 [Alkalihalobacillus pseudalcaliphilus]